MIAMKAKASMISKGHPGSNHLAKGFDAPYLHLKYPDSSSEYDRELVRTNNVSSSSTVGTVVYVVGPVFDILKVP